MTVFHSTSETVLVICLSYAQCLFGQVNESADTVSLRGALMYDISLDSLFQGATNHRDKTNSNTNSKPCEPFDLATRRGGSVGRLGAADDPIMFAPVGLSKEANNINQH